MPPPGVRRLTCETHALGDWDSGLVTCLIDVLAAAERRRVEVDQDGLPSGLRRLVRLTTAVPERQGAQREPARDSILTRIGKAAVGSVGRLTAGSDG